MTAVHATVLPLSQGQRDIWFDEKLIKGMWPPGNFGFPRVYITTYETDQ